MTWRLLIPKDASFSLSVCLHSPKIGQRPMSKDVNPSLKPEVTARNISFVESQKHLSDDLYGFRQAVSAGDLLVDITHTWFPYALFVWREWSWTFQKFRSRLDKGPLQKVPIQPISTNMCSFLSRRLIAVRVNGALTLQENIYAFFAINIASLLLCKSERAALNSQTWLHVFGCPHVLGNKCVHARRWGEECVIVLMNMLACVCVSERVCLPECVNDKYQSLLSNFEHI